MDKRVYQKYLKRSETRTLEPFAPRDQFSGAVVIPALAEYDFLPETLSSLAKCKPASNSTIVVIIINSSTESSAGKLAENVKTLGALRAGDKEFCGELEIGKELFWINATSAKKQISAKGGVGEARKIAMDSCLEILEPDSLFFCLDADTLVSENYLSAAYEYFQKHKKNQAATMNFAHRAGKTDVEHAAIEIYESFMRYYVRGLEFAGSPYAFYALGSAIICRAEAYVRAGGMRARNGGEDFYFMQAVSKFGHCGVIKNALVRPSARPSDRVPFGTGPKVREIIDGHELLFYNPEIFKNLKVLLDTVNNLKKPEEFKDLPRILSNNCDEETLQFLEKNKFET
ncbi:MAG: glycosyltransferase family 2 protein, partial [Victivallaceae bacterium]|nr:glycosyltransferase family 2 protein [Victivallaceae bacterium]